MGTVDVSVLELSDGMAEVLASNGDTFLGGADYDNAIVKWAVDKFKTDEGIDLTKDSMAFARVIEAAEKAKIELSSSASTDITLPYIGMKDGKPLNLDYTLSRAQFEQLVKPFNDRTVEKAKAAIKKAKKQYSDIDCILLVGGTTRIPSLQEALKKEFGRPLNQSVNPDEAVALGAAKQANVLAGNSEGDLLLLDVTPLTLGIETKGDVMAPIVEANTTIPCQKKQVFTTSVDNQPSVNVVVLQGERPIASANKTIGTFTFDGIPMAKAGVPQIEVVFDIDANGIVTVTAKDLGTNKEQHITIQNNKLSDEEIKHIKEDAEKFKEADEKKKKEVEDLNQAEHYMFSVKEMIVKKEFTDKLGESKADEIAKAQEKLDALESLVVLKYKDHDKIMEAKKELEDVWNPLMQEFYAQAKPEENAQEQSEEKNEEETKTEEVKE